MAKMAKGKTMKKMMGGRRRRMTRKMGGRHHQYHHRGGSGHPGQHWIPGHWAKNN